KSFIFSVRPSIPCTVSLFAYTVPGCCVGIHKLCEQFRYLAPLARP
ncbi:hypothetical protein FDUTEX481_03692, partial [Tolypothrix sp. PCC 7601]